VASYRGLYINLDRHADRRSAIEEELRKFGIADRYRRFPAVDGSMLKLPPDGVAPGAAGCFWSHYRALEQNKAANACIHVLEDDAILSRYVGRTIENGCREGQFDGYDIVFTEMFVGYNAWNLRDFKQFHDSLLAQRPSTDHDPIFSVADISSVYLACTSSYIVAPHAIEHVAATFKRGLDQGPRVPIDVFMRQEALEGRLKLGCIFPFTTTIRLDQIYKSTINTFDNATESLSILATALLRYSFFVDRDLDTLAKPWMDAITAKRKERKADRHLQMMTDLLGFVMSDDFKPF
jgi:GR25 family glycosyltransferase involved in LPS biosynthesis